MIANALLMTNSNTLQVHLPRWPHKPEVGGSNPSRDGGIFKNYLCKLPIGNQLQLGEKLYCTLESFVYLGQWDISIAKGQNHNYRQEDALYDGPIYFNFILN